MIKIRELLSWQLTQEPDRHKPLVKQLERSRATRGRRIKSRERK